MDTGLLEVSASELKSGGICGFLVYGANDKVNELRALDRLVLVKNKITVGEGPLILVTNAGGEITLSKNKINCKDDVIIAVKADEWGVKGANMGNAMIDLVNQSLKGDIYVDSISSLELYLKKGGKLNGAITGNPCDGRSVNVHLEKGGAWTVKGDVYVNRVTFEQPLKKGLKEFGLSMLKLVDYEVRIPPGGRTDALVEATITWSLGGGRTMTTTGVDSDQLVAAVMATEKILNHVAVPAPDAADTHE